VKSTVIFRGREMVHNEIGRRILNRLAAELTESALIEVPPRQEGMTMVQILSPKKEHVPAKPAKAASKGKKASGGDGASREPREPKEPKEKKPRTPPAASAGESEKKP
jgi:translation initiation factor IF-3-like protein